MRWSAGYVETKAQSNAITQPYGAKARMVARYYAVIFL